MKIEKTPGAYKVHIEPDDRKPEPHSLSTIIKLLLISPVAIFLLYNVLSMLTETLANLSQLDNDAILNIISTITLDVFIVMILNVAISAVFQDDAPATSPLRIEDIVKTIEKGGALVYLHNYQVKTIYFEKRRVKEYYWIDDYYVITFDDFDYSHA